MGKNLWKVKFNWFGEVITRYTHAHSRTNAFSHATYAFAKELGKTSRYIRYNAKDVQIWEEEENTYH